MPEKIESMTPEQEAQIPGWTEKWVKIGLSTEPVDFEYAKERVLKIYDIIERPRPTVLFADSPFAAIKMGLEHQLGREPTKQECYDGISKLYCGSSQVSSCAYITFFRDVLNWENETLANFKVFEELCSACDNVWWEEDVAVIVNRPEFIKLDDEGRQHSEEGPSLRYRDGWTVCCWHGTRVPREWLMTPKSQLDPRIALTWEDIEQRRCFSEIVGWESVLNQLDAKVIHQDDDPEIGTLLEVDLPDVGTERFLRVKCGTGRFFAIPVPPDVNTAMEAQASTWGIDVNEFVKPEVRT